MFGLPDPGAVDFGEAVFVKDGVVGFATSADEGVADFLAPDGAHAFTGVAAVALAEGGASEDGAADATEVVFVNPGLADGHDVTAVVEHEAVAIGVAKEVEGDNGVSRASVEGVDGS